ncbi:hypothetical protein D1AOALGA4SA_1726 [Olavius algarvensis Delta 1 endosymbiont]|nr:hypothetical protein D1AOALGA4SA_1726 [Olavius algarvensis Delta 1 endosymbiont]
MESDFKRKLYTIIKVQRFRVQRFKVQGSGFSAAAGLKRGQFDQN